MLFEKNDRHFSAESLPAEAQKHDFPVSLAILAIMYNTLNQFTAAGLSREAMVESGRSYLDINVSEHHHFYGERNGDLINILGEMT